MESKDKKLREHQTLKSIGCEIISLIKPITWLKFNENPRPFNHTQNHEESLELKAIKKWWKFKEYFHYKSLKCQVASSFIEDYKRLQNP